MLDRGPARRWPRPFHAARSASWTALLRVRDGLAFSERGEATSASTPPRSRPGTTRPAAASSPPSVTLVGDDEHGTASRAPGSAPRIAGPRGWRRLVRKAAMACPDNSALRCWPRGHVACGLIITRRPRQGSKCGEPIRPVASAQTERCTPAYACVQRGRRIGFQANQSRFSAPSFHGDSSSSSRVASRSAVTAAGAGPIWVIQSPSTRQNSSSLPRSRHTAASTQAGHLGIP